MFYKNSIEIGGRDWILAPLWRRLAAMIVDLLIVFILVYVPFINFVLMIGYGLTRDSWKYFGGKSIGKQIFNLRIMNQYTRHDLYLDYPCDINRNLFLVFLGLDFFTLFFSKSKRRLGDKFAKTVVLLDSAELKQWNKQAYRNSKRYVNLFDDWDSHGVR